MGAQHGVLRGAQRRGDDQFGGVVAALVGRPQRRVAQQVVVVFRAVAGDFLIRVGPIAPSVGGIGVQTEVGQQALQPGHVLGALLATHGVEIEAAGQVLDAEFEAAVSDLEHGRVLGGSRVFRARLLAPGRSSGQVFRAFLRFVFVVLLAAGGPWFQQRVVDASFLVFPVGVEQLAGIRLAAEGVLTRLGAVQGLATLGDA